MCTAFYDHQRSKRNPAIRNDIDTDLLTIVILPGGAVRQEATHALLAEVPVGITFLTLDVDLRDGYSVQIQAQLSGKPEDVPSQLDETTIESLLEDLEYCARFYCLAADAQEEIVFHVRDLPRHYRQCLRAPLKTSINSRPDGQDSQ